MKRIFLSFLLVAMAFLSACGQNNSPKVEVLQAEFGRFNRMADGEIVFSETNVIPLKVGQGYGWAMRLKTNQEKVKYIEQFNLSGPTTWQLIEGTSHEISPDRKTITVRRERALKDGILFS